MITIQFNHNEMLLNSDLTLLEVLTLQGYSDVGYAVFINQQLIPRSEHATSVIYDKDAIEIMMPMQGG